MGFAASLQRRRDSPGRRGQGGPGHNSAACGAWAIPDRGRSRWAAP